MQARFQPRLWVCDAPANRLSLLSYPDGAHASFGDFFQQLVSPGDHNASALGSCAKRRSVFVFHQGSVQDSATYLVSCQQPFYSIAHIQVGSADICEVRLALLESVHFQRGDKN